MYPIQYTIEKAADNQSKTSTSGNEVGSRCQTEKMTHVESSLTEKAHQAFYSSSHEEETIELVQTRNGNTNPNITCKPRVRPLIEEIPEMTHSKKEAANIPASSFTSGEGDDSKFQDEHNKPSNTEMVQQFKRQTFYSSSHEKETYQLGVQSSRCVSSD